MKPKGEGPHGGGTMRPARFQIHHQGQMFPGFTTGERWNGWEVPYFEKHVADMLHIELRALYYDATLDVYVLDLRRIEPDQDEDYEPDIFPGVWVDGVRLYPVGAWTLCWTLWGEECERCC